MISTQRRKSRRNRRESGQALVFLTLALAIAFLGAGAFSVDMSNLWFHRQAAQNAADATCVAGAMDLLVDAQGGATGHQGFTTGTSFNCAAGSTWPICQYARRNGYSSDGTGNLVSVSFPTSVAGVPTGTVPPTSIAPTAFMRVDITDNVPTYFSGMLRGNRAQTVRAFAVCGVVLARSPIPILVLDPKNPPGGNALYIHGTPDIKIMGGPVQSIQVNSRDTAAIRLQGGTVDLRKGGPAYNGSDLGVYGGPATAQSGFMTAGNGAWRSPVSPISDPFAQTPAPSQPPGPTAAGCTTAQIQAGNCKVAYHDPTHGCPALAGCTLYTAGYYPNDITVKKTTAIFDPGVYYVNGKLDLQAQSMVRPGKGVGDGSGGTMFYFTGTPSSCSGSTAYVCVGSNSGSEPIDAFNTADVKCPAGPPPDPALNLPATLAGNVMLAPCTGTYGDPLGKYRGILFFANRASSAGGRWGGGGGFLLAGSMYFHHCNAAGTGVSCGANPAFYDAVFQLQGNSGSTSYVLGDIVTDNLEMGGTPSINMALNPSAAYDTLKATLLR